MFFLKIFLVFRISPRFLDLLTFLTFFMGLFYGVLGLILYFLFFIFILWEFQIFFFFQDYWAFYKHLLWLLMNTKKWIKIGQNYAFFYPKKKTLAKSQSPSQELEVGQHIGPCLPVYYSKQWNIESRLFRITFRQGVYYTLHFVGSIWTNC